MLIIRCPRSRQPERTYIVRVILDGFLGLPYTLEWEDRSDVELTLAEELDTGPGGGRKLIFADNLLGIADSEWLAPSSLPQSPLARWEVEEFGSLPVIYGRPAQEAPLLARDGSVIRCGLDLFGSCFFMLTRYEELVTQGRDGHGRYPAEASLAYREGFLDIPIVNAYTELLWSLLVSHWPGLTRTTRRLRRMISHDVDHPYYWHRRRTRASVIKESLADAIKRRDFEAAWRKARMLTAAAGPDHRGLVGMRDPFNTFDWLMEQSERVGLHSSFYFIPEQADPVYDGTYLLEDPEIAALMRRIHERGHEIGIHPGYRTYLSGADIGRQFALLKREAAAAGVRQEVWGGRQHFLRWQAPETWQYWEDAGLAYDSSLGYSDMPGFRCGVCYEYPVFNLRTRKMLQLRERPLVVMEQAVLDSAPRSGAGLEQAFDTIHSYYRQCVRYGGDFTLLWHNSHLVHAADRELYSRCLEELK